jgi:hypothetical protein
VKVAALLLALVVAGCGSVSGKKSGESCKVSSECATGLVCDVLKGVCGDNLTLRLDAAVRDAAEVDGNMVDDAAIDARVIDARVIDAQMLDAGADAADGI